MGDVLHRVKENRNILQTKRRKDNWNGHILLKNCLLKRDNEGKIEGRIEAKGRRGRRLKQLLNDLKGKREYWKPKKEKVCLLVCTTHEMKVTLQCWTAYFCNGLLAVLSHSLVLLIFI